MLESYIDSLLAEIRIVSSRLSLDEKRIDTIYLGGGTPSLLRPSQVEEILKEIQGQFLLKDTAEITLEANPGTTTFHNMAGYWAAGINRLSFGAQSFNNWELKALGRIHRQEEIMSELAAARKAGFSNISLDLIYGLPGQTLAGWTRNLKKALAVDVPHLSMYALMLEEDTPLFRSVQEGVVSLPDDDLVADMFDAARLLLQQAGWRHYEVSNWSKTTQTESVHNKAYWKNHNWLGLGVAAHSNIGNFRFSNTDTIETYIQRINEYNVNNFSFITSPAQNWQTENDPLTEMRETMMLGFRLLEEGIDLEAFNHRFGVDAEILFSKEIAYLTKRGLIEKSTVEGTSRLRLCKHAVGIANQVFKEFV